MILVTGGAGFIGSNLVDKLVGNEETIVIDNLSTGNIKNVNKNAKFYEKDIRNEIGIEKVDIVYHLAAQINVRTSLKNPKFDAENNIIGIINILEYMRKNDIEKIIFSSSGGAVYGEPKELPIKEGHPLQPTSPYGMSKYASEEYIKLYNRLYGIKYAILRFSNVYGPRQDPKGEAGVISIFLNNKIKNKKSVIFGGSQTRDFVYVGDVVNALVKAKDWEGIYNIGYGKETSILELYNKISKITENMDEAEIKDPIKGEVLRTYLDINKAKEKGWEPKVDLEEGIQKTYGWLRGV